jgi:4-alpha-glucanotransferase
LVVTPGRCWLPDTLWDEKRRFGISLQLYMMRSSIVVGEDLGTVPAGFRERLEAANVLSYRVFMFEQNADGFILKTSLIRRLLSPAAMTWQR